MVKIHRINASVRANAQRSMTRARMRWLKEAMGSSRARFKFVLNSRPISDLGREGNEDF